MPIENIVSEAVKTNDESLMWFIRYPKNVTSQPADENLLIWLLLKAHKFNIYYCTLKI